MWLCGVLLAQHLPAVTHLLVSGCTLASADMKGLIPQAFAGNPFFISFFIMFVGKEWRREYGTYLLLSPDYLEAS